MGLEIRIGNMIEVPFYREILNDYPKELVHTWEYIKIGKDCRLHYKTIKYNDKIYGFYFHSVLWCGNDWVKEYDDKDNFEKKNVIAETLLHGISNFDGIRHLYFGSEQSENKGYFYYPDLDLLNKIIIELAKLEKECCLDADKRELNGKN